MALGLCFSWNEKESKWGLTAVWAAQAGLGGIYGFKQEWDLSFGLLHVQYGNPTELERLVLSPDQNTTKPKPSFPTLKIRLGFHFVSPHSDTAEHDILIKFKS